MKNIEDHQLWLEKFYAERGWDKYSPFVVSNFITEEVGELARAIRSIEIGRDHPGEEVLSDKALEANLIEELADCMDQILILCSKFGIQSTDLLAASETKLINRFKSDSQ